MKLVSLWLAAVLVFGVLPTDSARAEDPAAVTHWAPPVPALDDFDWIQLKSGEWLKGRIKAMQDKKLEFTSEELDQLEFDWEDIHFVRSPRNVMLLFSDRRTVEGTVIVTRKEVVVGGQSPQTFNRADLDSITMGMGHGISLWSGKVSAGVTFRTGNSEQVDYNASINLQRRTPGTRFSLDYIGNISELDGVQSANNHRVNTEFDLWLSQRLYLVLPFAEYLKDPFQNLQYRANLGLGVGYDIIDTGKVEWSVNSGPAYQVTQFESVEAGEDDSSQNAVLVFGSRFDWQITPRIELILEYRGQYTDKEVGETTHHSVATLELEMTKVINLDVSLIWDRVSQPKADKNGVVPDPDDFRLVLSLGLDF